MEVLWTFLGFGTVISTAALVNILKKLRKNAKALTKLRDGKISLVTDLEHQDDLKDAIGRVSEVKRGRNNLMMECLIEGSLEVHKSHRGEGQRDIEPILLKNIPNASKLITMVKN